MSKVVIADSTCLIGLARIGRLKILRQLFGEILIAPAVYRETVVAGRGRSGAAEIEAAAWIRTVEVIERTQVADLSAGLGAGEAESIVLALEQRADFLVLDDRHARDRAAGLGAAAVTNELRHAGFWFKERGEES